MGTFMIPSRDSTVHTAMWKSFLFFFFFSFSMLVSSKRESAVTPPLPVLPLPTHAQLKWQQKELVMFFHFGINTFTDREWGTGRESPSLFNPTDLNASQWIQVAAEAGFSSVILTAKHHDGFCLWPSKYTTHSVTRSRWRNGGGDVVKEFIDAASAAHVDAGLYLSPWDRHDRRYGSETEYNEFYLAQLQELLNRYGSVSEIWFDGAKGANAPNMSYHFGTWFSMVKELQGSINIFSNAGPDLRWVGNENGFAGETCWSSINGTSLSIGNSSIVEYLNKGDPSGTSWVPPECDVSIRPGWFWHAAEKPKSLSSLLEIYYKSVGRNCVLLLNIPPNSTGLISEPDLESIRALRSAIDTIFFENVAENCSVMASGTRGGGEGGFGPQNVLDTDHLNTYWAPDGPMIGEQFIEVTKREGWLRFNVIRIQEPIGLGQRISLHTIYADGKLILSGTTIGYKKIHRLDTGIVLARKVRIIIKESRGIPLISSFGLYLDPFWNPK